MRSTRLLPLLVLLVSSLTIAAPTHGAKPSTPPKEGSQSNEAQVREVYDG